MYTCLMVHPPLPGIAVSGGTGPGTFILLGRACTDRDPPRPRGARACACSLAASGASRVFASPSCRAAGAPTSLGLDFVLVS